MTESQSEKGNRVRQKDGFHSRSGSECGGKAEARQAVREVLKERLNEEDKPALREEAIRQILEEFLA